MDFQVLVESLFTPTCVVSVEKKENGGCGEMRIAAANKKYADMIGMRVKPGTDGEMLSFVPGELYTEYFPQNSSFEDVCFRAAILKKEVHTYALIPNINIWFDIYVMPLDYEDEKCSYCTYSAEITQNADALVDTFNTSQTANDVLKTCIQLHKANNLKEAMECVIKEIRLICKAKGCTVLLLNNEDEEYSILATDFVPDSSIKRVTEFEGYYNIANSWKEMLGDEGDCIIVRNKEEMDYIGTVNAPWHKTLVEAGVKSVVLFPLRQGNELLGYIWAVNFDTENTIRIKETLQLTTFFLSSHIAR